MHGIVAESQRTHNLLCTSRHKYRQVSFVFFVWHLIEDNEGLAHLSCVHVLSEIQISIAEVRYQLGLHLASLLAGAMRSSVERTMAFLAPAAYPTSPCIRVCRGTGEPLVEIAMISSAWVSSSAVRVRSRSRCCSHSSLFLSWCQNTFCFYLCFTRHDGDRPLSDPLPKSLRSQSSYSIYFVDQPAAYQRKVFAWGACSSSMRINRSANGSTAFISRSMTCCWHSMRGRPEKS